ncbi:hypothetical protein GJ496_002890 [Pomphorhynchus laevis]|nr:hypothetical protein GJ496_002890 [Pomphorhynchus laevis]
MVPSIKVIKGIILMDDDGNTIVSKYFCDDLKTETKGGNFEKDLFSKMKRSGAVIADQNENPLLINSLLQAFYEALNKIFKRNVDCKTILQNLELIFILIDEMVEDG